MPQGLPVSRLINVDVVLTPTAAQAPNLNSCLIVGSSNVINVDERIRSYADIEEVVADFGTNTPEYEAAALFFGQTPQPDQLYIGRWAESATHGFIEGDALTPTEQTIGTWTAITTPKFDISIDGDDQTIAPASFAGAASLNVIASRIQTALQAVASGGYTAATCVWDATNARFVITSGTTGAASTVSDASTPGSGTDISGMLKMTAADNPTIVDGIAAETPVACIAILDNQRQYWYLTTFASDTITDDQEVAVAGYIEAANNKHLYGVTTTNPDCLDINDDTDIMSRLKALGYNRTFSQYSQNPYAAASFLGRAVTVNFNGNSTVITMMYKGEPGVTPEQLTSAQADALKDKNGNVYVDYNNDTSIIQYGAMASGVFFDDMQDLDWLANAIQTAVFNLLYTSATKIPQTDAGNHLIMNAIEGACQQAVANGTLAPGQWNANGFGQLVQGQWLDKGYYIYAPPIYLQSQADREARKSVPFQIAAKLAGAVHTVDVTVNVNR